MTSTPRREDQSLVSGTVIWWLLAVSLTFLLGFFAFVVLPGVSDLTWNSGITANVALAVLVGGVLGWKRQWRQILVAITLGSVVTVLGLDALLLVPTPTEDAHVGLLGLALLDGPAVLVALVGMTILVGVGAIVGVLFCAVISRRDCLEMFRRTFLGSEAPRGFGGVSKAARLHNSAPRPASLRSTGL